ncbi:hypothetical protein E2P81_ATG04539 [Venturia nashicola]|uniref:Large ribosomal subunit protein uL23m n=1 Tax=Venturia nashicola TaxID=86259 RepID=A0A4Z1NYP6_9PEZI|nr:hypothetical protein E6O75_ATG04647 [Venturia nashicola]TLD34374.1 hypothetical protein E2P81_ATG04539 [Venturia nashicola]
MRLARKFWGRRPDTVAGLFTKGHQEIYLPNFTVTFVRSPALPPNFAKFIVPLNLNKFDIRDYLFHAYNVRVLKVRSFITQSKVETNEKGQKYRKRATKTMTVEMTEPFVWPKEPEDFELWSKDTHDAAAEYNEKYSRHLNLTDFAIKLDAPPREHRKTLKEQARALLSGKEKWEPTWQAMRGKRDSVVDSLGSGRYYNR